MSTLAYAALTTRRDEATPGTSRSTESPGVTTYVDAMAALVPTEVLTLHAVMLTSATSVADTVTTIVKGAVFPFAWAFIGLIVLASVLYAVPRMRSKKWDNMDWIRCAIPALAFVAWTMLQRSTAFEAAVKYWNLGIDQYSRTFIAAILAVVLGLIASSLAYQADQKPPARAPAARQPAAAVRGRQSGNGLKDFSMHALDERSAPMFAKLTEERASAPAFALIDAKTVAQVDPETIAKRYLQQALASKTVPALTAPKSPTGDASEFKSLGTETLPLTGTTTVKFRQTFNQIPVYGSLVTVELDDANQLLGVNSSIGDPTNVDSVAKVAPSDAVKAVDKYPGYRKQLGNIVPHLNYYFDQGASKWRLVFILEDVPVRPEAGKKTAATAAPQYMDYVVDAQTAKVIAQLPRTPSMASVVEDATDGLKKTRKITIEDSGGKKTLKDANPPAPWHPCAVSAHANAESVADFLRTVLRRNNIDNKGGAMNSSINCVVAKESPGKQQWFNAFWNGSQMVYGQRLDGNGGTLMSLSVDLDVVGHEMFHGVTDSTARLEYAAQSGALNESYSDIFGIIIANFSTPDTRHWNWKVGEGLSPDGKPFRDMEKPELFGQPANMKDFKVLPNTQQGDWGGVHTNSGIHNKAAYNVLTATDDNNRLVFKPPEVAAIFYIALTQYLSRTSQFKDSKRGVIAAARSLFRTRTKADLQSKITALDNAFSAVGIS